MKEKIGIYGGMFDPIHFGHINLAIGLKEKKNLSEVWVIPAFSSPLTKENVAISPLHRLKMVQLAVKNIPGFRVLDLEVKRPYPSYTIDTVNALLKENNNKNLFILLGEDILRTFTQWKQWEEIIQRVGLLIGTRADCEYGIEEITRVQGALQPEIVKIDQLEISSTVIRERIKNKLYCGHLVPKEVLDYIYENQLYFNNKQ